MALRNEDLRRIMSMQPVYSDDKDYAHFIRMGRAVEAAVQEHSKRAIEVLHWVPRVEGRWDETDVAHAEGFNKAKTEALQALRKEQL